MQREEMEETYHFNEKIYITTFVILKNEVY